MRHTATIQDSLREAICAPERGMLLDAGEVWQRHRARTSDQVLFLTSSGRYHRQFVSLWELFDQRDLLNQCVDRMAEIARQVRDEKGYTTIVTSTLVAKHLVERVHALIESADYRLTVRHLGPYPFLAAGNRSVMSFANEKVLIVADVMDSGNVVGNLAKAVRDLGGTPVAALCLVLVNAEHVSSRDEASTFPLAIGPGSEDILRVHSLSDCTLEDVPQEQIDPRAVQEIKLDPETLLPLVPLPASSSIPPAIDAATMYNQLEASGSIAFDFFRTEAGVLTTAIRFDKLFAGAGKAIWRAIRSHFEQPDGFKPPMVLTTFDSGDTAFKDFVADWLRREKKKRPFLFAGRRDDGEYFILDRDREPLEEQTVVLLLSSLQTGQKVKDLATLLASRRVREIRVVCLVNRMGRQARAFLGSIRQLMRGLGDGSEADQTPFNIYPVYNLSDLSSEDIRCAQDTVRTLFDYYHAETRVPSFRRWVNQLWVYFESKALTTYEFANGAPTGLSQPQEVHGPREERFTVGTEDAKLSLICARAATDREYDSIIEELTTTTRKHTLYKLFAILLADVSHLRMVCHFKRLRHMLNDRIMDCRARRFQLEDGGKRGAGAQIDKLIELEMHLLFGWALLSYLDHNHDYGELAKQVLTCGKNVSEWDDYPENFARFYGEEQVVWTVSLLLLLSHPRLRTLDRAEPVRCELTAYIKDLIARVQAQLNPATEAEAAPLGDVQLSHLLRIKSNLDMLLTELGGHELRLPVQIIRYLHSLLLKPTVQHSPIETNMGQAITALHRAVARPAARRGAQCRRGCPTGGLASRPQNCWGSSTMGFTSPASSRPWLRRSTGCSSSAMPPARRPVDSWPPRTNRGSRPMSPGSATCFRRSAARSACRSRRAKHWWNCVG
jgi:orotate phosphoribosyltransferase